MIMAGAMFNKLLVQGNTKTQKLYATAGSIADEVLTLVRTVISFGTQHKEAERYEMIHQLMFIIVMYGRYNIELEKLIKATRFNGFVFGLV